MSTTINIVFCCDDVYADKLAVSAYSLLCNTQSNIALYIIDCGINWDNQQDILALRKRFKNLVSVEFKQPEKIACFESFPVSLWFSTAIFYRLAIPQIFPMLERAIYLDCDVIVDSDIIELWDLDLGECSFGALNDEDNMSLPEDVVKRKKLAGIPLERTYMSSGVMVFNLPRFRDAHILERVIEVIKNPPGILACPEQDAMNICIDENEYLPIDPRFNFTPFAHLAKERIREGTVPVIIHYSCGKPWLFNKNLVKRIHRFGLFRYDLGFIKKYWTYSDELNLNRYSSDTIKPTLRFLYKRAFGPIEYFVAKKLRNGIIRTFKRVFCANRDNKK